MACGACGSLLFCQALRLSSQDRRSDGFQSARKRIALVSFLPSLSSRVWAFCPSPPRPHRLGGRTRCYVVLCPPRTPSHAYLPTRPSDSNPHRQIALLVVDVVSLMITRVYYL